MKTYLKAVAALAIGATMMVAAPAMARVNVDVNVGLPGVFYPAPVYVQPRPVYVQPQPVYVQPEPVYYGRHWDRGHHRGHYRGHGGWDRDGDGVPNRYDRRPNNPYRH